MSGRNIIRMAGGAETDADLSQRPFNKRDWAWEFLRSNVEFLPDWENARGEFEIVSANDSLKVIIAHKNQSLLDRWGCLFADAPHVGAQSASVFWKPEIYAGILPAVALSGNTQNNARCFHLGDSRCPAVLLLKPGRVQHLLFQGEGRGLQLRVEGADVRGPVHLWGGSLLEDKHVSPQLSTLRCFNDLLLSGCLPPGHHLSEPGPDRLEFTYRALQGSLAGLSHRKIAIAIFGEDRVRRDWYDAGEHMRDTIRRAIKCGRERMEGGYLKLLRSERGARARTRAPGPS
jgi:hypothetical protein